MDHDLHEHDRGLAFDLSTLWRRRRLLGIFGGVGITTLATLVGCGPGEVPSGAAPATTGPATPGSTGPSATNCERIPQETAGPFPGDGSNGPNVLTQSGIVRSDIRASFGSAGGVAKGVPLTINLTIVDAAKGCAAFAGAAVYLWQCDAVGAYSLYSQSAAGENYLRGVQQANSAGAVSFQSIFPGAYSGRWPHAHFEVYPSLSAATSAGTKVITSQLALPKETCDAVYATGGYGSSAATMSRLSLSGDSVFRDGWSAQMATITGDAASGYVASLTVPV